MRNHPGENRKSSLNSGIEQFLSVRCEQLFIEIIFHYANELWSPIILVDSSNNILLGETNFRSSGRCTYSTIHYWHTDNRPQSLIRKPMQTVFKNSNLCNKFINGVLFVTRCYNHIVWMEAPNLGTCCIQNFLQSAEKIEILKWKNIHHVGTKNFMNEWLDALLYKHWVLVTGVLFEDRISIYD